MKCLVALRRQRQVDLCEFESSLVYTESSRTARATSRDLSQLRQNTVWDRSSYRTTLSSKRDLYFWKLVRWSHV